MKPNSRLYQSYLLRMWRESVDGEWRASLQNVATCESHNFASLADLFAFIRTQAEQNAAKKSGVVIIDRS